MYCLDRTRWKLIINAARDMKLAVSSCKNSRPSTAASKSSFTQVMRSVAQDKGAHVRREQRMDRVARLAPTQIAVFKQLIGAFDECFAHPFIEVHSARVLLHHFFGRCARRFGVGRQILAAAERIAVELRATAQ